MTLKDDVIEYLAENATLAILVVSLAVLLAITAQASITDSTTVEEKYRHDIQIESGGTHALVDLTSGAKKPIVNYDGNTVTEISGWESQLTVDGQTKNLWHHEFEYSENPATHAIHYSRASMGYELKQMVTVRKKKVIVEYYIVPTGEKDIKNVVLELDHYRWYYSNVTLTNETAHITYKEGGVQQSAKITTEGNVVNTYINDAQEGPNYFTISYQVSDPPVNEKTLLAREVITIGES